MKSAKTNENKMALYHWSYPFEFHFLNQYTYDEFAEKSTKEKEEYYQSIIYDIISNHDNESANAITGFYSFIFDNQFGSSDFKQYMAGFYQTLVSEIIPGNFETFAKKSLRSVDVYGTGIALLYLLKRTKHLLSEKMHTDLYELGRNMVSSKLSKRETTEDVLLNYENILTEHGLMSKYNIHFMGHTIEEGNLLPKHIEDSLNSIKMKDVLLNKEELEKNAVTIDITSLKKIKTKKARKTKKPKKNKKTNVAKSATKKNKIPKI
jgi:hypothetical protein